MIGLLPAAGKAERMHHLPKYLLPVPGGYLLEHHVTGMRAVGCEPVWVGCNLDNIGLIFDYTEDSAYVYIPDTHDTMTQTVLGVRLHIAPDEKVLFSMPDTYWDSPNVFLPLQMALENGADIAVALFVARFDQRNGGMCRITGNQVTEVVDKPGNGDWRYIWGALAWTSTFWDYMQPEDPHIGYALPRAIAAGLDVRGVLCDGDYWGFGTPGDYFSCLRSLGETVHAPA